EYLAEAFRLHQQHARRDESPRRVRREMTEGYVEFIERRQHVQRMLRHRIIGVVRNSRRPVAFTATTPVDTDHAHAPRKQRRGQLDPLLASEVAMDEDD